MADLYTTAQRKAAKERYTAAAKQYAASIGQAIPEDFLNQVVMAAQSYVFYPNRGELYSDGKSHGGWYWNDIVPHWLDQRNTSFGQAHVIYDKFNPKAAVDYYVADRKNFIADQIRFISTMYVDHVYQGWNLGYDKKDAAFKKNISKYVNDYLANGGTYEEVGAMINEGAASYVAFKQEGRRIADADSGGFWGSVFDVLNVVAPITLGLMTGGMGLVEGMIANAAFSIAQGGDIKDVLKGAIANLAAAEVPGFLDKLGANVSNPNAQAIIDNVAKQVTATAIQGGDIKSAALGGLAGGVVSQAGAISKLGGDYNAQISRAAGEYVQAKAAGLSEEQALTNALSGFISQTEKEQAREKVLQKVEAGTYTDPTKPTPKPGTAEFEDFKEKSLPTVEVVDRFQPTIADNLSIVKAQAQLGEKSKSKDLDPRYRILLSLINAPTFAPQFTGGASQQSSSTSSGQGASPGTSALAQALRTDTNETIIAGDKSGKRKGWNLESLRYMGNSGG